MRSLHEVGLWTTRQSCTINSHSARYTSHRSHIAQSSVSLWGTIQCCPIPLLVVYRNYVICEMRTLQEVRHSRTLPAAITALPFLSVVLVVSLNFHRLILFPRTLISLLVKVLLFCHYRSRQFFIKCQKAPNRCCGLMMRKPKGCWTCHVQVSLQMSDILSIFSVRKMIAFPNRKRKRVTKRRSLDSRQWLFLSLSGMRWKNKTREFWHFSVRI